MHPAPAIKHIQDSSFPYLIVCSKLPFGLLYIFIYLPIAAIGIILSLIFQKSHYIINRVSQQDSNLMRKLSQSQITGVIRKSPETLYIQTDA